MTDATIGVPPEPEDDVLGAEQDTVSAPLNGDDDDDKVAAEGQENGGPAGVDGADRGVGMAEPVDRDGE